MKKTHEPVRRGGRAVAIDEMADPAGGSPMTLSRVINGHAGVCGANRERVMRSVRELGCCPNLAASARATAQHTCMALICTHPSASYLRELLVGALRGSANAEARPVIATRDGLDAGEQRAAARQLANSISGVILPPPLCESGAIVAELARAGTPVVSAAVQAGRDRDPAAIDGFQTTVPVELSYAARRHARPRPGSQALVRIPA